MFSVFRQRARAMQCNRTRQSCRTAGSSRSDRLWTRGRLGLLLARIPSWGSSAGKALVTRFGSCAATFRGTEGSGRLTATDSRNAVLLPQAPTAFNSGSRRGIQSSLQGGCAACHVLALPVTGSMFCQGCAIPPVPLVCSTTNISMRLAGNITNSTNLFNYNEKCPDGPRVGSIASTHLHLYDALGPDQGKH